MTKATVLEVGAHGGCPLSRPHVHSLSLHSPGLGFPWISDNFIQLSSLSTPQGKEQPRTFAFVPTQGNRRKGFVTPCSHASTGYCGPCPQACEPPVPRTQWPGMATPESWHLISDKGFLMIINKATDCPRELQNANREMCGA